MTPDVAKKYLELCGLLNSYDIDGNGVDAIKTSRMRWILKRLILRGHNIDCALCGKPIDRERDLTMDHIVPHSCGGSDDLHNMQPAHRKCNELKGNSVSDDDIAEACAGAEDSIQEIKSRKVKRKELCKKHRNIKRIKPWQIDNNRGR